MNDEEENNTNNRIMLCFMSTGNCEAPGPNEYIPCIRCGKPAFYAGALEELADGTWYQFLCQGVGHTFWAKH